jgi:signal transduction histidine kinase
VIRAELGLGILGTALWIYCLFDVIMTDESRIRNLPKVTWIFIVLITSVVGAVAWLVGGRPQSPQRGLPYKGNTGAAYPEYERPGRFVPTNPDDDAEFLRKVRERAEAQTREAKRQRLERERLEAEERERRRQGKQDSTPTPAPDATPDPDPSAETP